MSRTIEPTSELWQRMRKEAIAAGYTEDARLVAFEEKHGPLVTQVRAMIRDVDDSELETRVPADLRKWILWFREELGRFP